MARKVPKRVSLVDAQKEIDGDREFCDDNNTLYDSLGYDFFDPCEEQRIWEEWLQREDDERERQYYHQMNDYDPYYPFLD